MKILWRKIPDWIWWSLVWGVILLLGGMMPAWARPGQQPAYQTVPTLPPTRPPATPTPIPTPAPPPAVSPMPEGVRLEFDWRAALTTAAPGNTYAYELRVRNAGGRSAGAIEVWLTLPAQVTIQEVRLPAGRHTIEPDGRIHAAVDDLAPGEVWNIIATVQVRPSAPLGTVMEAWAEVRHAGGTWKSPVVSVALPPAELPPTGGIRPRP